MLKDDGCSSNVVSTRFLNKNRILFQIQKRKTKIHHSRNEAVEEASEVIFEAKLELDSTKYRSKWVVSNCRYGALHGMPWHVVYNPRNDYVNRTMEIDEHALPTPKTRADRLKFINIGVKNSRPVKRKISKELWSTPTCSVEWNEVGEVTVCSAKES